jgi:hypothetical protein
LAEFALPENLIKLLSPHPLKCKWRAKSITRPTWLRSPLAIRRIPRRKRQFLMRMILVDHTRANTAAKRGGTDLPAPFELR